MISKAGVYRIKNDATGKVYIGRALNIAKRWTSHRWHLDRGKHRNGPLQADWQAHGSSNFTFEVLQKIEGLEGDELNLALAEAEVDHVLKYTDVYNLMEAGQLALTPSASTRALWSKQRKALWSDPEYKERMRASQRRVHEDTEYAERRAANIRAARGASEQREKTSEQTKMKWAPGGVLRETQGAKRKANWQDPEYRAKQKASRQAAWADPEIRAKRSAAIKAAHARRRATKAAAE